MGKTKYDYIALKTQYIQSSISIRELCRRNGIPSWSSVAARANREGWDALRAEFQRQVENRQVEVMAEKRAKKIAAIEQDLLEVVHAGILKMAEDMDAKEPVMDGSVVLRDENGNIVWRPVQRFGPNQLQVLVQQYLAITGKPIQIQENRNLNANLNADLDHDELRAILTALRPRPALAGPERAAAEPYPQKARSN